MTGRMETLDADLQPVRTVADGKVTQWLGGKALAWIPDRQPGEEYLRIVDSNGVKLAVGLLTDRESELRL